jgi:hypothetical protein
VLSRFRFCRNVRTGNAPGIAISGETRRLSVTNAGSSTKAVFGAESDDAVVVTHSGAGPAAFVAVQPAGRAGAVTPSKFWLIVVAGGPST